MYNTNIFVYDLILAIASLKRNNVHVPPAVTKRLPRFGGWIVGGFTFKE